MSETPEKTPESNLCTICGRIKDLGIAIMPKDGPIIQRGMREFTLCPGHPKPKSMRTMNISYTSIDITFTCANCGIELHLTKRSPDVQISGTFCPQCDEQYYTRWDGVLHQGKILTKKEDAHE